MKKLTAKQLKAQVEEEIKDLKLDSNTWKSFHLAMTKSPCWVWKASLFAKACMMVVIYVYCMSPSLRQDVPEPIKNRYNDIISRDDGESGNPARTTLMS